MTRCEWANASDLEQEYHDKEWGRPVHDNRLLFEFLILEGAQAGLSWSTILKKRKGYRKAFDNFQANKIARYSEKKIAELLSNPKIVRNKLKVNAAVKNAGLFLDIQDEFGSFDNYIWQFVGGRTIQNSWKKLSDIPASSAESEIMSKELKKRGFKFVGPTMCYAFMQAVGMVNDHTIDCHMYHQIKTQHDQAK
ncbi:MAG: DNA-3-methyladenine glycosylase I [Desulfobacterales bacterium]|nr:DNA-3-methyladenine glycosylase I [Deltaproteobacteria bacterium]NNL42139.1 DNA-3-methyladenine glycosylase I [Desulfobacterales bacterium]